MARTSRSVRLPPELEQKLDKAAAKIGVSPSALIRTSVERTCSEILCTDLESRLAGLIGAIQSPGSPSARQSGKQFAAILDRKRQKS
ncbi:MAG: hypothetical protein FJZ00_09145 [Candidatus Sericytochromatia bacterium]|uniref:Uncharacterized protein n=1 Tax=Candidatus Tanganyikabacteria bacterium TaxID=2961651 RepID=A0A937X3D4_9BACT|nr:hypothetical protein [Candidatus Tanganyikabacteria bacterium]